MPNAPDPSFPNRQQQHINDAVTRSHALAFSNQHEYMSLEHLALALLADPSIAQALERCEADISEIEKYLLGVLKEMPKIPGRRNHACHP